MATAPVLRLNGLAKFYGPRPVFRNVNLELAPGEILILSGPNGSGKSTLLKIIAGLSLPSAGTVELSRGGAAGLGYLAHQTFLYPQLTALENLRFWSGLHKLDPRPDSLEAALSLVGLERLAGEKAGLLSRGQAQRLSLARLLLQKPALLLLDEPDSGLDAGARALLGREIAAAAARGAAVLRVSHGLRDGAGPTETPAARRAEIRAGQGLLFYDSPAEAGPVERDGRTVVAEEPC